MEPSEPNIFVYTDFRLFLQDYYKTRKAKDRKFSHRYIIEKVGATSAGWFSDVVNGRIALTSSHLIRLAKLLRLKPNEDAYFEALVHYGQAGSMDEKNRYLRKALAFKEVKADLVGKDRFEFYSKWYYTAIRELLFFHDFRGDYTALGKKVNPPIRAEQAKQAVRLLEKMEFIAKAPGGGYQPRVNVLRKDPSDKSLHLANFLKTTMELGIEALERYDKEHRDVSALTLSLSEPAFQQAREEIKALRKRLLALMGEDSDPAKVYQCNIQFFPLTQ